MPRSAAIFAADGAGGICVGADLVCEPPLVAAAARDATGACVGALAGAGAGWDGFALASLLTEETGAPPPSLIWPSSAPGVTVSPSFAVISASAPAAGAFPSSVTLSVSSSTSGSSALTASPAFLNHLPIVASLTDSPSVGTRISVAMVRHFAAIAAIQEKKPRRQAA